jgi:hypothetical protein
MGTEISPVGYFVGRGFLRVIQVNELDEPLGSLIFEELAPSASSRVARG